MCVIRNLFQDGQKLPFFLHSQPVSPDISMHLSKVRLLSNLSIPSCQRREWSDRWVKDIRPLKHMWQHKFHEDCSWKPSKICQRNFRPNQEGTCHILVQPRQLLPDFRHLGCTGRQVHATCCSMPFGTEVHGPLRVAEAGGRAIRRGHVEVVAADHEIHELPALRGVRPQGWTPRGILVLQVAQNHRRLEHTTAIAANQCRHLLQRVDPAELGRLKLRIRDGADLNLIAQTFLINPQPNAGSIVRVKHVEENWPC
mmetsp:Transcript_59047/g.95498  ORF Transcript_59047/g.95498 Transcript_59047/m.95498 type:complete len:255 (-) Transcript_59047:222-986(-)